MNSLILLIIIYAPFTKTLQTGLLVRFSVGHPIGISISLYGAVGVNGYVPTSKLTHQK